MRESAGYGLGVDYILGLIEIREEWAPATDHISEVENRMISEFYVPADVGLPTMLDIMADRMTTSEFHRREISTLWSKALIKLLYEAYQEGRQ